MAESVATRRLRERPAPTPRRRVALVVNILALGGAEKQVTHLARALAAAGDDVRVISILPPKAFAEDLEAAGVPLHVVGGARPTPVRTLRRAVGVLRDWRPDALISFTFQANALGIVAGRLARVPVVITSIRNERFGGRRRELILRALLPWSTVEVVNSPSVAARLLARRVVRADRLRVVPNSVDAGVFRPDPAERARVRAELGVGDGEVLWLAVGRMEPQKDHETLLEAFARLETLAPLARLAIVGDGSRRDEVDRLAAGQPERVQVLGRREDVPALLAAADGVVMSSRWEGLPNALLEAMAAGLPVVATRVGGVAEIVEDGRTGRLVDPGEADALAAALAELTALSPAERAAMGESARAAVASTYSPASVVGRWSALVDELRGAGGPAADPRARAVALFLQSFGGGGAQRVFLAMADLLVERGWEVDLVVARPTGVLEAEVPTKAQIVDLDRSRTLTCLVDLARYLRARRPAALLSTLDSANLVALAAARLSRTGTPVVLRVANHTSSMAERVGGRERWVYRLARRAYRHADVLAAPSRTAAEDLDRWVGLDPGSTVVLANPVVTDQVLGARPPVDDPWFAPGAPPVVLSVGRLQPHKGQRSLLRAFAAVERERPARLLVLGDGPERSALEGLAAELGLGLGPDGDVWFRGFDPDPFPAMAGCGVFVLASEIEGLPGSLIQALACGARVVSTDCPGASEVLDGGRFGRLVPVGDADALAAAIREALDAGPGGPGPDACARYGVEVAVDAYDALVRGLGSRGPGGSRKARNSGACAGW